MERVEDTAGTEVFQRWVAQQDAQWWGRMRAALIALAVLCSAAALLSLYYEAAYYLRLDAFSTQPHSRLSRILTYGIPAIISGCAFPLALILGLQRARTAAFTPEQVLAFSPAQAYALQTQACRAALWRTALQLAAVPLLLAALAEGLSCDMWFNSTSTAPGLSDLPSWDAWLRIGGYAAVFLLMRGGAWLCLLEWQALLAVRIPPKVELRLIHALPFTLWMLCNATGLTVAAQRRMSATLYVANDMWLFVLVPAGLGIGLMLAPQAWRWAAQSLGVRRWLALGAVCAAGMLVPMLVYVINSPDPVRTGQAPQLKALLPLAVCCRGVYAGNALLGNTSGELQSGPHAVYDTRQTDPGLRLAPLLFIPLWLAPFYIFAYYAYSYWVLRRAGADPPPGYRGTWDEA